MPLETGDLNTLDGCSIFITEFSRGRAGFFQNSGSEVTRVLKKNLVRTVQERVVKKEKNDEK